MAEVSTSPFGEQLRRLREAVGLTQEELAERAGLSRDAISALEGGRRRYPHPQTVRALAVGLGLSDREALALRTAVPKRSPEGPSPSLAARSSPLPVPSTRLVGRQRELAELRRLVIGGGTRLVTLTGPGGVGKTRLALELARELEPSFGGGGVAFVPLAPIADPALVLPTVAAAVGVHEGGVRSLTEQIGQTLRDRHLLLVLDNVEHLIEAAPQVADLLAICPGLAVLATSRATLRLSGEHEYPVPPLAAPLPGERGDLASVAANAAVALFAQRARAAGPPFALTAENAAAVAEICRRLDGLPLALELAAARVKVLPPEALLARLEKRLPLLTGGPRDALPRQRTMRDAIAWSYDLLDASEQRLFRRLAVFAGGFTLEAAEYVGGRGEGGGGKNDDPTILHPPSSVLDLVASLVDKSLLRPVAQPNGGPGSRFEMLETIREYGLERLAESGEEGAVRAAHAAHFLAFAEQAEPALIGPEQGAWLARVETEHDNLRLALEWLRERGRAEENLRLAGALSVFWEIRGHLSEGRRWLAGALAERSDAPALVAAKALRGAGVLAREQGDYGAAAALGEEALALFRELGDTPGIARTAHLLGDTASDVGDYERAAELMEEALALFEAVGDASKAANLLNDLGVVARRRGEYDRASILYEASLAKARVAGDELGVARTLSNLGHVAADQNDHRRAVALYREGLALQAEVGDRRGIAWSLERLAALPVAWPRAEHAARLFGAADAARDAAGLPLPPAGRDWYDRAVAEVRARLGEDAWTAAWAAGRALPLPQAIAEALALADELAGASPAVGVTPRGAAEPGARGG